MLSENLEAILNRAFKRAREQRNEFMTVEDLLLALLEDEAVTEVIGLLVESHEKLTNDVRAYLDSNTPTLKESDHKETQPTLGFQRVLQRAVYHVQTAGGKEVAGLNVLVAIFGELESHAVYLLNEHGVTREDVISHIHLMDMATSRGDEYEEDFKHIYDEEFDYRDLLIKKEEELDNVRRQLKRANAERSDARNKLEQLEIELLKVNENENKEQILRSIQFPPECRQAGMSILGYFSEVVNQKYPEKLVTVSIEQDGEVVRLRIETDEGDREIIEETLEQYGLVVKEKISSSELFDNKLYSAQLENKLELAKTEIRSNERLLILQQDTIATLKLAISDITKSHESDQKAIRKLIKQNSGNENIEAALKTLEKYSHMVRLNDRDNAEVQKSVITIYREKPEILSDLKAYFVSISASLTAQVVINTLRIIGF